MKKFNVEVTDTFAGEANYCWVRRLTVGASTTRGAMRIVEKSLPYLGGVRKDYSTGCMERWVWRNAAVCAFIEEVYEQA